MTKSRSALLILGIDCESSSGSYMSSRSASYYCIFGLAAETPSLPS